MPHRACRLVPLAAWLLPTQHVAGQSRASEPITRPVVSEDIVPLLQVAPVARDGHRGTAFIRNPPGSGPFPVLVWIHGGLATRPEADLREYALGANPSRFLVAGYVVAVITYRSRDEDPQSRVSLEDSLAVVNHVRRLPYVDPKSVVVFGCSAEGTSRWRLPLRLTSRPSRRRSRPVCCSPASTIGTFRRRDHGTRLGMVRAWPMIHAPIRRSISS